MVDGRVAFCGDQPEAEKMWAELQMPIPMNFNPSDHYLSTLSVRDSREEVAKKAQIAKICNTFKFSETGKEVFRTSSGREIDESEEPRRDRNASEHISGDRADSEAWRRRYASKFGKPRFGASFVQQIGALTWRASKTVLREPTLLKVQIFQSIVSLFLCKFFVFWNNECSDYRSPDWLNLHEQLADHSAESDEYQWITLSDDLQYGLYVPVQCCSCQWILSESGLSWTSFPLQFPRFCSTSAWKWTHSTAKHRPVCTESLPISSPKTWPNCPPTPSRQSFSPESCTGCLVSCPSSTPSSSTSSSDSSSRTLPSPSDTCSAVSSEPSISPSPSCPSSWRPWWRSEDSSSIRTPSSGISFRWSTSLTSDTDMKLSQSVSGLMLKTFQVISECFPLTLSIFQAAPFQASTVFATAPKCSRSSASSRPTSGQTSASCSWWSSSSGSSPSSLFISESNGEDNQSIICQMFHNFIFYQSSLIRRFS